MTSHACSAIRESWNPVAWGHCFLMTVVLLTAYSFLHLRSCSAEMWMWSCWLPASSAKQRQQCSCYPTELGVFGKYSTLCYWHLWQIWCCRRRMLASSFFHKPAAITVFKSSSSAHALQLLCCVLSVHISLTLLIMGPEQCGCMASTDDWVNPIARLLGKCNGQTIHEKLPWRDNRHRMICIMKRFGVAVRD